MQNWLPIIAALVGALGTFGLWAYLSRQRLAKRAAELERNLEIRTTELESARIQLQRLSTEDPLTAVANHEQFLEFLEREWRRVCIRSGVQQADCRSQHSHACATYAADSNGDCPVGNGFQCPGHGRGHNAVGRYAGNRLHIAVHL